MIPIFISFSSCVILYEHLSTQYSIRSKNAADCGKRVNQEGVDTCINSNCKAPQDEEISKDKTKLVSKRNCIALRDYKAHHIDIDK